MLKKLDKATDLFIEKVEKFVYENRKNIFEVTNTILGWVIYFVILSCFSVDTYWLGTAFLLILITRSHVERVMRIILKKG